MGLDTFAGRTREGELTKEDVEAFDSANLELCGGMYSGGGGSFRGKVYDDVVRHLTGVGLYEEWIPPETVREMAAAFERCDPEKVAQESEELVHPAPVSEIVELRQFFRICAERGLGLVGWW